MSERDCAGRQIFAMTRAVSMDGGERQPKLLFFVEPFPIRETLGAYFWVASEWLKMAAHAGWPEERVRFFSHAPAIEFLLAQNRELGNPLPPSAFIAAGKNLQREIEFCASLKWDPDGIARWREVLVGEGSFADAVIDELGLLKRTCFDFDAIVIWGQNGAVRRFCDRNGIVCINCELGATRPPLPISYYFDPWGCHGGALLPRLRVESLPALTAERCSDLRKYRRSGAEPRQVSAQPHALVALQTSDDANLVGVPEAPVKLSDDATRRVNLLCQAGYRVTVKGHPGAKAYAWTLAEQERCYDRIRNLPGLTIFDEAPEGFDYLGWLSTFDLVVALSSSLVFEASLAGVRAALDGRASFAAQGAFPTALAAIDPDFDWEAQRERTEQNLSFYLLHYAQPDLVSRGRALGRVADFHRRCRAELPDSEYVFRWAEEMTPMHADQQG